MAEFLNKIIYLDLFILGVYAKRWPKCTYFETEAEDHSIGKILSEKECGGIRLVSEKTEASHEELN